MRKWPASASGRSRASSHSKFASRKSTQKSRPPFGAQAVRLHGVREPNQLGDVERHAAGARRRRRRLVREVEVDDGAGAAVVALQHLARRGAVRALAAARRARHENAPRHWTAPEIKAKPPKFLSFS